MVSESAGDGNSKEPLHVGLHFFELPENPTGRAADLTLSRIAKA